MADVVLKNAVGVEQTYPGVETVTLPTSGGGTATFSLGGGSSVNADWAQTDPTQSDFIKNKPFGEGKHIYIETSGVTLDTTFSAMDATWAQLTEEIFDKGELLGCVLTAHFPDGTSSSATVAESNIIAEYDNGIILLMLGQVHVWVCFAAGEHTASNGEITVNATVPASGVYIPDYFLSEMSAMEMVGATKMLDNKYLPMLNVGNDGEYTLKDEYLPDVPHFNLIELGLGDPADNDNGIAYLSGLDNTQIMSALDKGLVRFTFITGGTTYTSTTTKIHLEDFDGYVCMCPLMSKSYRLMITSDSIIGQDYHELPKVTTADNGKVLTVSGGFWYAKEASKSLPEVTTTDDGKVLSVKDGTWSAQDAPTSLPDVTEEDDGKVLAVKNGEWTTAEASTTAGGSSGGITSWNDLTDKPFYEEFVTIFEGDFQDTLTDSDGDGVNDSWVNTMIIEDPSDETLVVGDKYVVTWNGSEYACVAFAHAGIAVIGNQIIAGGEDTGEPFYIARDNSGDMVGSVSWVSALINPPTDITVSGQYACRIEHFAAKKIDDKYQHQTDWNVTDKTSASCLLNRPFGEIVEAGAVITDCNANYDSTDFGFVLTDVDTFESHVDTEAVLEGATYSVEIAGIMYDGVGMTAEALKQIMPPFDGSQIAGIGIAIYQDGTLWGALASMQNILWFIQPLAPDSYNSGERYQVKITVVEAIKKIDAKYLPMDVIKEHIGSLSDGEITGNGVTNWNDLTDRPFGDNEDGTVTQLDNKYLSILDLTDGTVDLYAKKKLSFTYYQGFGAYRHTFGVAPFTLSDGQEYNIIWDGETYTRTAWAYTATDGSFCVAFGNPLVAGGENNEDEFAVVFDQTNNYIHFIATSTEASHDVHVYQKTPETYYVKNDHLSILRHTTASQTDILPETSVTFTSGEGAPDTVAVLVLDETYHVVWNDNSYSLTAKSVVFDGVDGVAVGNISIIGAGDDTGEPFVLGYAPGYDMNVFVTQAAEDATHKVRIYQSIDETYTVKEEHLPIDAIEKIVDAYIGKALGGEF